MNCPRCGHELVDVRSVAVCKSCGGAFLPSSVVDTVQRALDPHAQRLGADAAAMTFRKIDTSAGAHCPSCRQAMRRYKVGAVEVDTCEEHGSWYDRGELAQLKTALEAGAQAVEMKRPPAGVQANVDPMLQDKINALARSENRAARRRERATGVAEESGVVVDVVFDILDILN